MAKYPNDSNDTQVTAVINYGKKRSKVICELLFSISKYLILILQLVMVEFEIETLLKLCTIHIV